MTPKDKNMHWLGEKWNNCLAIYSDGFVLEQKYVDVVKDYLLIYPEAKEDTIWLDLNPLGPEAGLSIKTLDNKKAFSGSQFREDPLKVAKASNPLKRVPRSGKEHSFISTRENFLQSKLGNTFVDKIIKDYDIFKNNSIVRHEEIIFDAPEHLEKYKNSSVIIVSGGPSTKSVNWKNIEADFIWTCNNFFRDEMFKDVDVDLITLAPNVDFVDNKKLQFYLEKGTKVAFEIERGDDSNEYEKMKQFVKKHEDICSFFHTRYRGNPGVSLRLLCYAIFLGVKDIYFVGIDGFKKNSAQHAFENGKGTPNWFNTYGPRFQDRQFVAYWDYVLRLQEKYNSFNLYNLGQDHPYNVSGEISKKYFPLSEKIKKQISLEK